MGYRVHMVIQCYFYDHRITCINGNPKRLDIDNRLKHLTDQIFHLIDYDDSYVWHTEGYKLKTQKYGEGCCVFMSLTPPEEQKVRKFDLKPYRDVCTKLDISNYLLDTECDLDSLGFV